MMTYLMICAAVIICGAIVFMIRSPGTLRKITAGAAAGLMALAAVDLTSTFTGIYIAVSVWTIAVSALLGLPGVISILFLKLIWHI